MALNVGQKLLQARRRAKLSPECQWRNCTKPRVHRSRFCGTHRREKWRSASLRNEAKSVFDKWRCNARARDIFFGATFEYFLNWCIETNYLRLRGRRASDMTIDRIIEALGYVDGNYQMVTKSFNSKKPKQREKYVKQEGDVF